MRVLELLFAAPIPIGHRVEIRWYRTSRIGWGVFGPPRAAMARPHEPTIRDLDTGILYGPHWLFAARGTDLREGEPLSFSQEVRPDLELDRTLLARVLSCRVITCMGSFDEVSRLQTTLAIEEEAPVGPYR